MGIFRDGRVWGIIILAIAIVAAAVYFTAQSKKPAADNGNAGNAATVISAEEGKKLIDVGGYTLVDVRTADEYAQGHIKGAILIPNESIGSEQPAQLTDLSAPLIVYCRSGRRSAQAAEKLVRMGYTSVYDMGGIQSWPYEVVTEG